MHGTAASYIIRQGDVLLPNGAVCRCDVRIEQGEIREIGEHLSADSPSLDASGLLVLPGLIDLHTHGIGFCSTDEGALEEYARLEATCGATTFFPTYFGGPAPTVERLRLHRRETDELRSLPQIGGFRLESPYLAYTGAGISENLAPITPETTQSLLDAGGGLIKIWDLSPELPGACEAIRWLTQTGVLCSLAHTRATIEQARAAVDAGAQLVTHLFDTFLLPEMVDPGVYPAGLVDYLLVEDRVTCEIIGDGTHVHPLLVEKALRCKTPERLAFVTDSNYGAALPSGEYVLPNSWGRVMIDGSNHGVRLMDRENSLAGSALTPIDAFRNAVRMFGQDYASASRLCSAVPARLTGLNKGEIALGRDADIILLDSELELRYTIVGGQVIFQQ